MQIECIRVLLVEDDPGQVAVINTLLKRAHGVEFQLLIADRLSAGLECLTTGGMDIVLLDLSLPDSSGVNTFVKVRQAAPRMPIIVLTGTDDELLATELMRRGAQDYLFKGTIDGRLLVRAIRYSIFRMDSEEALEEQRRRHRLLMEGIPDVRIYFKDQKGRFLEVNQALARSHGLGDPQQAVGLTDYDLFASEYADQTARDEQEIMRTGQPILGKVERENGRDGTTSWALTTKMPLQDGNGRAVGVIGISRDITNLKSTEERLTTALEELTHSHEQLKETQLLLIQAEKLRSLGQMAASVAHEVRNPLAILHMGIECLDEFFFAGNETMTGVVKEMKGAVHRAEAIIRDMLDYSSARELELREVSVNGLVGQTLGFVRHELVKTKVRVTTQFAEGHCTCLLDAPKIEQVFINVFTNACHAMPGGGDLTVTTSERVIEIDDPEAEREDARGARFLRGDKVVTVEIRDSGSGIPEDKLDKLFDPFFTTKTSGNGTGLGLAVVKKIIDLHDGKISIANAEGGGARVTISLKSAPELQCNQTPCEVEKVLV